MSNGNGNGNNLQLAPTRDTRGRFLKGCAPGPGNPRSAVVEKFRAALYAAATVDDVVMAWQTLCEIARDKSARKVERITASAEILNRLVGKPAPAETDEAHGGKSIRLFISATTANVLITDNPQNTLTQPAVPAGDS